MGAAGLGALIPLRRSQRPCLLQRLFACEDLRPQMRFGMITFGEMRSSGVRDVLIYCRDHRCSHHITVNADRWPDDMRLSDVEPGFVCSVCGHHGADVRPSYPQASMGTG